MAYNKALKVEIKRVFAEIRATPKSNGSINSERAVHMAKEFLQALRSHDSKKVKSAIYHWDKR